MTRSLTTAAVNAVQAETVMRTCAVELDFATGFVRLAGSPADFSFGGNTFVGVGALGGISQVQESAELRSYGLTLTLAGVPRDSVAIAMGQHYQGRAGTVWEVVFDPSTHLPIADPILVFRGRMDQVVVKLGDPSTIALTMTNRLADWERPRLRRYTDEDQKRGFATDRGFEFVTATTDREIIWPSKGYTATNGPSRGEISGFGL